MGSGSSSYRPKAIYLDIDGRIQKVVFSKYCNSSDIMDLFCIATGLPRNTTISLLTSDDAMVSIDPTMPANSERRDGQTDAMDRQTPWTDGRHGQMDVVDRWTPWTDGCRGQTDAMGRRTPWADGRRGQTDAVDRRTPWTDGCHGQMPSADIAMGYVSFVPNFTC